MGKSKLAEANEKITENVVGGYKKIEEGVVGGYKKIEEGVVGGYKKIEEGVVGGYKKIENGAVGGFNKIADKFVDSFLTKEGESVEEARERLAAEQKAREEAGKANREERLAHQNSIVEENMQKAQNAAAEARRKAGIE